MIQNTDHYRIYTDPNARLLIIQATGTWAEIDALRIPDVPGVLEAIRNGIDEMLAAEAGPKPAAKPESAKTAPPKKSAAKKVNK